MSEPLAGRRGRPLPADGPLPFLGGGPGRPSRHHGLGWLLVAVFVAARLVVANGSSP